MKRAPEVQLIASAGRDRQRRAAKAVGQALQSRLASEGFAADGGHLVRSTHGVTEVIEAQHSVYGSRITANLGLNLEWLRPLVRWVPRPSIGPHAHDCVRWIRVGLVDAARGDRWWVYDEDDPATLEAAAAALAERVAGPGLEWLGRERTPDAFLKHAEGRVERSVSPLRPYGGYLELRLLAAVHAWRGEFQLAQGACAQAREQWEEERARLAMARKIYRRRHPETRARLAPVPNLQRELERLTAPTTGVRALRRAGARLEAPSSRCE